MSNQPSHPFDLPVENSKLVVFKPQIGAGKAAPSPSNIGKCGTCTECSFLTDVPLQYNTTGYTACVAQGRLLTPSDEATAPSCLFASTNAAELLVPLGEVFVELKAVADDAVAEEVAPAPAPEPEPEVVEAPTPAPAPKLETGDGYEMFEVGEGVSLPKYHESYWDDNPIALDLIPRDTDDDDPSLYVDYANLLVTVAASWTVGYSSILEAGAGTGKTKFAQYMAYRMGVPFIPIQLTNTTELESLEGVPTFHNGETGFRLGRLAEWYDKPCVILLDEPNLAPHAVEQFLRATFDGRRKLVIEQAEGGLVINQHKHCIFVLAQNPSHDGRYVGTTDKSSAFTDRMVTVDVPLPPADLARQIVKDAVSAKGGSISKHTLDTVMALSAELQAATDTNNGGTMDFTWGTRTDIKVALLSQHFDLDAAYMLAIGNSLDPMTRDVLEGIVKVHTFEAPPVGSRADDAMDAADALAGASV